MVTDEEYTQYFSNQYAKGLEMERKGALIVAKYSNQLSSADEDKRFGIDVKDLYPRKSVRAIQYEKELFWKFKYCFTLRKKVRFYPETEFDKIMQRKGADALVYCWRDAYSIREWIFIDLKKLADAIEKYQSIGTFEQKYRERESPNGTKFICLDSRDFPDEILIAASFLED